MTQEEDIFSSCSCSLVACLIWKVSSKLIVGCGVGILCLYISLHTWPRFQGEVIGPLYRSTVNITSLTEEIKTLSCLQ